VKGVTPVRTRTSLPLILLAVASTGATWESNNFVVEAPTIEVAERIAKSAERHRKEIARLWLGKEMPDWRVPCPVRITLTPGRVGGGTTFIFDSRGGIVSQDMHLEGPLEGLLARGLPHEVTHTVFAYYFRCQVPRWADEGGSVLSEDAIERDRHDLLVRKILNTPGRSIRLRTLFGLTKYPRDAMVLYAEGYSVTSFLVGRRNRPTFLSFVDYGMCASWDEAVQKYYGYRDVEELEEEWLKEQQKRRQERDRAREAGDKGGTEKRREANRGRRDREEGLE
jgi:hypothetical protein